MIHDDIMFVYCVCMYCFIGYEYMM